MRRPLLVALAVVLLGALALGAAVALPRAQQWWKLNRTVAPDSPLHDQCDEVPEHARRVTLEAGDGVALGAAEVGDPAATIGVLLRYGASQTLCDWLPWAGDLAEETGARVLVFDRRGRGASPAQESLASEPDDVAVAARRMRADGVEELVLVGSSMGNSITLAALPLLEQPACALVSISPVLVSGDGHGTVDGSRTTRLPAQTWVTWESRASGIVANAELLLDRAADQGGQSHALEVETDDHSRQLVANHAEVAQFVEDAVSACGRG